MSDAYEYSYDWDISYCYENSNVLRNKLGITDAEALRIAEREISSVRVLEAIPASDLVCQRRGGHWPSACKVP